MQAEADHQHVGEAELVLRRRLADREALREVVQADPDRDEEGEPARRRQAREMRGPELRRGCRARAEEASAAPGLHPRVVVHEAEEAECEPAERERRQPREPPPARRAQRRFDRVDRLLEHVPEKEEQDPGRGRAQEGLERLADVVQPAHRQADEDRQAGDGAEQEDVGGRHL